MAKVVIKWNVTATWDDKDLKDVSLDQVKEILNDKKQIVLLKDEILDETKKYILDGDECKVKIKNFKWEIIE